MTQYKNSTENNSFKYKNTYIGQCVFKFQHSCNIGPDLSIRGGRFLGFPNCFSGPCDESSIGGNVIFRTFRIYEFTSRQNKCGLINLLIEGFTKLLFYKIIVMKGKILRRFGSESCSFDRDSCKRSVALLYYKAS